MGVWARAAACRDAAHHVVREGEAASAGKRGVPVPWDSTSAFGASPPASGGVVRVKGNFGD